MTTARLLSWTAAAAWAAAGCAGGATAAPGSGDAGSKARGASAQHLTWDTYDAVKAHVQLRESELTYQSVPWRDSVSQGLEAAQTQDKPLLLWLYFGGPRGAC